VTLTRDQTPPPSGLTPAQLHEQFTKVWDAPPGFGQLSAVNHTSVGLRFIVTGFVFFLLGGLLAMLMRSQIAWSDNDVMGFQAYNELFTMHGTTMMFLFAVPILEGFAIYLTPKILGARDMPMPRLGAFGYWCYLFGGALLYSSFLFGHAPDTGWFMYTPLSDREFSSGKGPDFWLLGITFVEISALAAAVEIVVSVLKTRAPGMSLERMPLLAWAMLVMAFMIVFGFPPLIIASVLLEVERAFGFAFYDALRGGDPLLWQHLFWIFGHPEVYIILVPGFGLVSAMIVTFSRHTLVGYRWCVLALLAIGFVSFGLWAHHMYAVGLPFLTLSFFAGASMAVAIPSGIVVFAWITTLWKGRPVFGVPMLYIAGGVFIFVAGGLTGVMVALVPFDWQVHDTHFVVAHFHYTLVGSAVMPVFAALYYWLPLAVGRTPSEAIGRLGFWLIFIGFNVTFLPMHLTGLLGMPRRVYTYAPDLGWDWLNLVSTVGGFVMSIGVGVLMLDVAIHYLYGRRAARNPWNAGSLEWAIRPGVPPYNFISIPPVTGREPLWERPGLAQEMEEGRYYLADPRPGRREMFSSGIVGAQPEAVICLSKSSWWPLVTALPVGLFFIGILTELYDLSIIALSLVVAALVGWAWTTGDRFAPDVIDVGGGLTLPMHATVRQAPGWWGTVITLLIDVACFMALLFAYFFLWAMNWSAGPLPQLDTGWWVPAGALALLVGGSVAILWGLTANRQGRPRHLQLAFSLALLLALGSLVLQGVMLGAAYALDPHAHSYGAVSFVLLLWVMVHVGICVVMLGFAVARSWCGWLNARRELEARVPALFWHYTLGMGVATWAVLYLFPWVA
jgi:cytochrome c oxidase subunit I+III